MEEILRASAGAAKARGEPHAGTSMGEELAVERSADVAGVVGPPIGDRALGAVELSDCPLAPGDEVLDPWEQGLQERTQEERLRSVPKAWAIIPVTNHDDRGDETEAAGATADAQRQWESAQRAAAEFQDQGERETDRAVEEVRAIADAIARRRAQAGHGKPEE
jgi:hypothetical protein